jgi:DNA-binding response OmpR family regulator
VSKVRILIVEDVEEMRVFLEEILNASGKLEVVATAANGWEARVAFERKRPDWVLLDELLPGESSLDLLHDFRAEGARVIIMSGMGSESAQARGVPPESAGRVSKPEWDQPAGASATSADEWLQSVLKCVSGAT